MGWQQHLEAQSKMPSNKYLFDVQLLVNDVTDD
jgi:hypothetical protein